jgi:hypothetical protein
VSEVHVVLHAVPLAHVKGAHDWVGGEVVLHVPLPLHVRALVSVLALQDPGMHTLPAGQSWQAPAPLQAPVVPQVELAIAGHWLAGNGAVPASTLPQVPSEPPVSAAVHAWHVPVHAVLQQTPLAQKPLPHWLLPVHGSPMAPMAHVPEGPGFIQVSLADSQSALDVHEVLHDVALAQARPPPQAAVVPAMHVPVPLHVLAAVSMPLLALQDAARHVAPDAQSSHAPLPLQLPSLPHEAIEAAAH